MMASFLLASALGAQAADPTTSGPQMMGFETVKVADQEVRVAITREEVGGRVQFCRQYVKSYKREIAALQMPGMMGEDTTSLVLGTKCTTQ
ncbi:hypothetical protein AWV80_19465 [Cupriavidus sp. UYMU48A]|nr:hypothetical protein AWV80_19465 [Cupriavidus sp. UYMU48A]